MRVFGVVAAMLHNGSGAVPIIMGTNRDEGTVFVGGAFNDTGGHQGR
jgi:hypothetical protein